jgi:hypothetical protein
VGKLQVRPAFVMSTTFDNDVIECVDGEECTFIRLDSSHLLSLLYCHQQAPITTSHLQQLWAKIIPTPIFTLRPQA